MHVSGYGSFNKTLFIETSQGQHLASILKFLPYFQIFPHELVQEYLGTLKVQSQQAKIGLRKKLDPLIFSPLKSCHKKSSRLVHLPRERAYKTK